MFNEAIGIYEEDLKRIVCLHPVLIEDGLKIEREEYPIWADGATYRCDLKGKDTTGQDVFIELKLKADYHVVYQIAKYKTFVPTSGRFVVAALDINNETMKVLKNLGFEVVKLDAGAVNDLFNKERENPLLYVRKTESSKVFREKASKVSMYSEQEKETVSYFMDAMKQYLAEREDLLRGFKVLGIDVRSDDKYRLLLASPEHGGDRFLIYNRARVPDQIHLMFVPDFSFSTGSNSRKKAFEEYMVHHRVEIEGIFGLALYTARGAERAAAMNQDHLVITCQGWKGFSQVYIRPKDCWKRSDFIEMVGSRFIDFIENTLIFVDEFNLGYQDE